MVEQVPVIRYCDLQKSTFYRQNIGSTDNKMYSTLNLELPHVVKRSNEFNHLKYEVHVNNYMTRSFKILLLIWHSS